MKLRTRGLTWALAAPLALGLVAVTPGVAAAKSSAKLADATLNGSGSTFQQAFDEEMISAFTEKNGGITINYAGGGSGKGRQDFADQVVDFAGTDAAYPSADLANVKGGEFLYVPTVVAPITMSYNLPDVPGLKLSGPTISKIFQRTITKWNDPAIAKENPKADLPDTDITVARRADSSGTTQNFTEFLTKSDPSGWKLGTSSTISWPSDTQGGQGNAGVAEIVAGTEGAIGYVDLPDAKAAGLKYATIKNQLGKYIKPTVKSASEAAATVAINDDLTYDPIYATGATSYPITSPTWVLVYKNQEDAAKGKALKAWLKYILTKGEKAAAKIGYAAIPASLSEQALAQLKQVTT